jgi:hypothetical protein
MSRECVSPPACPSGRGRRSSLRSPLRNLRTQTAPVLEHSGGTVSPHKAWAPPSGNRSQYSLASLGVQQGNFGLPVQYLHTTGLLGILSSRP